MELKLKAQRNQIQETTLKRPFIVVVENSTFLTVVCESMFKNNTKALNHLGVIKGRKEDQVGLFRLFLFPLNKWKKMFFGTITIKSY